jgi:aryl-alcohol dehydrogenase-like predicted oxidoreductase
MQTRTLGRTGPQVSAIGLGCMGMSGMYGPADRAESLATIHAALDAGITLLDTGDFYGMGHNELLIAEALRDGGARRDKGSDQRQVRRPARARRRLAGL